MSRKERESAPAKINLALHVRRRRDDGYHEIETLFAFVGPGDAIVCEAADELTLRCTGPFAGSVPTGPDNLVLRAAEALREQAGVDTGAALTLDKHLPVEAGLGGGSADAAAVLRALPRLWGCDVTESVIHGIAERLGADVPACLRARLCYGTGTGTTFGDVAEEVRGLAVLLVNPGVAVPTGPVFAAWDGEDRGPLAPVATIDALRAARNDLEAPARSIAPEIGDCLDALRGTGPLLARMSGSGATCFALYADEAAAAEAGRTIAADRSGWWNRAGRLQ